MPDKHRTFAERAEQRARAYPRGTTDMGGVAFALLAIYHLLEERLPRTKPPGDLSDVVDIRPGSRDPRLPDLKEGGET